MVFYVTTVTFQMALLMNKCKNIFMDDDEFINLAKTLPSLLSNLSWNIVMDDWNLDENHLLRDINCNTLNL